MRYFDRNTVKIAAKHHNKQEEFVVWGTMNKEMRKRFRRDMKLFSYKVADRIWWNSLSDENKENVFNSYQRSLNWNLSNTPTFKITDEWINREMDYLKQRYSPEIDVRRGIVIDIILEN